ncbi:uncharacterized protein LOC111344293 [Stylophora pistillata]|uniref:uncharacterized protein LOC111344293 n=1 Tax=Stylophora pistillata TaxID=50429 RepID=UPI000C056800|nr:uncharacterized protein LOC111344293 [Stylophora pistillata]
MATTTAKAPAPLNLFDRLHQGENWKLFRREWKFYELAAGIHRKADEVRVASLLNVVVKEGLDTSQLPSASLDCYITALMKLSENCGFGTLRESLVLDRLILGVKDDRIREKLLGKCDLDLDKAVEIIKASQVTHSRASEIPGEASAQEDVNAVKHKPKPQRKSEKGKLPKSSTRNPSSNSKIKEYLFCGGKHALDRKLCPASGQTCKKCGKVGHFSVKCRSKSVNVNVNDVKEVFYLNDISGKDQALAPVTLNDTVSMTFQIDIGSSSNILQLEDYIRATNDFKTPSIIPKDITLVVHDHSKRKALGSARLKVEHDANKHELNFVIVDQRLTPLLGLKSCRGMGLVKIMVPGIYAPVNKVVATPKKAVSESITTDSVLRSLADVFQGICCLPGEYSISLQRDCLGRAKKDGPIRVCLDPKDLNSAIKRSHYPLPTGGDVTSRLTKAKVFSVVDAKTGFWQVKLSESSSYYTTFKTLFGRFRWFRMPFGISSAPEKSTFLNDGDVLFVSKVSCRTEIAGNLRQQRNPSGDEELSNLLKAFMLCKLFHRACFALALIALAGHIESNPGYQTLHDIRNTRGLKIAHLNIRSLVRKTDSLCLEGIDSKALDILYLSET